MPTITEIPEEKVNSDKGYYHGVYFVIHLNKEEIVDRKEIQSDV